MADTKAKTRRRLFRCLIASGIKWSDAKRMTDRDLMKIPNLGKRAIALLREMDPGYVSVEKITRVVSDWQVWTPEMQEAEFQLEYSR